MRLPRLNGWLRLWIVGSVLWALFIGFSYGPSVDSFRSRIALVEFVTDSGEKMKLRIAVPRSMHEEEVKYEVENGEIAEYIKKEFQSGNTLDLYTGFYNEYITKHSIPGLKSTALIIFVPIFSTLLLGRAIVWVRRGFEQNST